jgi:deazaflavin-dependent oxidoreductase (nitroreductase family)
MFATAALLMVLFVGMRSHSPRVRRAVRRTNRRFFNPMQMRSAGQPGAYASVVRHRGRHTGHEYTTPVAAVPVDDGFLVALPYGTQSDWLQNVLAAGSATIVHEGHAWSVDSPSVVPLVGVFDEFPASAQRSLRWFHVDDALHVRRVPVAVSCSG